jgi:hypothetical protein
VKDGQAIARARNRTNEWHNVSCPTRFRRAWSRSGEGAWSKRRGRSPDKKKRVFWPRRRGEIAVEKKRESLAREMGRNWSSRRGESLTEDDAVTFWPGRSHDEMPYLTDRPCGVGR